MGDLALIYGEIFVQEEAKMDQTAKEQKLL